MGLREISFFIVVPFFNLDYGYGLTDNIFYFNSFKNPAEWDDVHGPYSTLCTRYTYDMFLEPRHQTQFDNMRASQESLSPVRIKTKDVLPAKKNLTLHIFNNPGIRKGYSVSYGFFRNKECLHGQDHYCITSPEFGRVRAVVLNAERFAENENLNYIKDHFLLEPPQAFVTILNEGSSNERKFYEAVFLGGYPTRKDASRSSHWIDGKTYPLEIYMYFVDETVPSMALTTILVVLVEESDRDNPHVKPIVSTVNNQLYNLERKFLETHKVQRRRAKLFHHMQESTIYDDRPMGGNINKTLIRQTTVSDSIRNEDVTTAFMEAYEQMEAISAELYFLDEDRERTFERQDVLHQKIDKFNRYEGNQDYYPFNNNFTFALFYTAIHKAVNYTTDEDPFGNMTCEEGTDFIYRGHHKEQSPRALCRLHMCGLNATGNLVYYVHPKHPLYSVWMLERNLSIDICKYLYEWNQLIEKGYDNSSKYLKNVEKYDQVQQFITLREISGRLRIHYLNHAHWAFQFNGFKTPAEIPTNAIGGLEQLMLDFKKRVGYRRVLHEIDHLVDEVRQHENFPDIKTMRDVIHFMKYGNRNYDLRYRRPVIQKAHYKHLLPEHQKKRGYVEFGNLEIPEADLEEDIKRDPRKAFVGQAFQISWLIPPDGGYYVYEGSSPLPPCYRAQTVIVFKKPITMSRSQIEALTRIPVSFHKHQDIKSTHPIIHDLQYTVNLQAPPDGTVRHEEVKVPVYFQKRNHLFLGFDGVNQNAVEQSDRIKSARNQAGSYYRAEKVTRIWITIVMLHYTKTTLFELYTY